MLFGAASRITQSLQSKLSVVFSLNGTLEYITGAVGLRRYLEIKKKECLRNCLGEGDGKTSAERKTEGQRIVILWFRVDTAEQMNSR